MAVTLMWVCACVYFLSLSVTQFFFFESGELALLFHLQKTWCLWMRQKGKVMCCKSQHLPLCLLLLLQHFLLLQEMVSSKFTMFTRLTFLVLKGFLRFVVFLWLFHGWIVFIADPAFCYPGFFLFPVVNSCWSLGKVAVEKVRYSIWLEPSTQLQKEKLKFAIPVQTEETHAHSHIHTCFIIQFLFAIVQRREKKTRNGDIERAHDHVSSMNRACMCLGLTCW